MGSLMRAGLGAWLPEGFPWSTVSVNYCGTLLLVLLYAFQHRLKDPQRLLFMVGFCGSLTTVSSLTWEFTQWIQQGEWMTAAIYGLLTLLPTLLVGGLLLRWLDTSATREASP
jgi:fluoride ion exporter CrcB/FEX